MTYKDYADEITKRITKLHVSYERYEEKIAEKYRQALLNEEDIDAANYYAQLNVIRLFIRQLNQTMDFDE